MGYCLKLIYSLFPILVSVGQLAAQTSSLHGQITDESGAVVIGAQVVLRGPGGKINNATSGNGGFYSFDALPPGNYVLQASAPQLVLAPAKLLLKAGSHTLALRLKVATAAGEV